MSIFSRKKWSACFGKVLVSSAVCLSSCSQIAFADHGVKSVYFCSKFQCIYIVVGDEMPGSELTRNNLLFNHLYLYKDNGDIGINVRVYRSSEFQKLRLENLEDLSLKVGELLINKNIEGLSEFGYRVVESVGIRTAKEIIKEIKEFKNNIANVDDQEIREKLTGFRNRLNEINVFGRLHYYMDFWENSIRKNLIKEAEKLLKSLEKSDKE